MKKYQIIYGERRSESEMEIINKCCCCGGDVVVNYEDRDRVGKIFAEVTDVCVDCFSAGCKVLTGEMCQVTGKRQAQSALKKLNKSEGIRVCQCCSCEQVFTEVDLREGSCPYCSSENWVKGYIDEPEPKEIPNDIS